MDSIIFIAICSIDEPLCRADNLMSRRVETAVAIPGV